MRHGDKVYLRYSINAFNNQNDMDTLFGAIEKIKKTGFIAQEVEKAAKDINYDFSGVVAPKSETDLYSLRYDEFVVPLVKAVQGQQQVIEALQKQVDELVREIKSLKEKSNQ